MYVICRMDHFSKFLKGERLLFQTWVTGPYKVVPTRSDSRVTGKIGMEGEGSRET